MTEHRVAREPGRGIESGTSTLEDRNKACLPQEKQEEGKDPEGQPTASTPESEEWNSSQPGMVACVCVYILVRRVYMLLEV